MKIHGGAPTGIAPTDGLAAKLGKARARTNVEGSSTTGEVKVSREAMALAAGAPARFDAARVDTLRDAHDSGSLRVDSKVIAKRLAEEN